MSDTSAAPLGPIPDPERSRFLDVLRGIALLGILPANLPLFAIPMLALDDPAPVTGGLRETFAYNATRLLVDYKFITIFSLLFGVGLMVIRRRREAAAQPFRAILARRLGVMLGFGVLHAVLLWWGDILSYYGAIGLVVVWAAGWQPKTLRRVGIALLLLPVLAMIAWVGAQNAFPDLPDWSDWGPGGVETSEPGDFWRGMPGWSVEWETHVYREGAFWQITVVRAITWFFGGLLWGIYFDWRIAGLFLLGMAWAKEGWFLWPGDNRERFRRLALWGGFIGGPLQLGACLPDAFAWEFSGAATVAELLQYTGSLGVAALYVGAIGLAVAWFPRAAAWRPFEAVGRTAFSNYILQSLACSTIFYAYGLGLYGSLDRFELWGVMLGVWALQLAVSPLWLAFFRFGPLEWLWRAVTYLRRPPMRASA